MVFIVSHRLDPKPSHPQKTSHPHGTIRGSKKVVCEARSATFGGVMNSTSQHHMCLKTKNVSKVVLSKIGPLAIVNSPMIEFVDIAIYVVIVSHCEILGAPLIGV